MLFSKGEILRYLSVPVVCSEVVGTLAELDGYDLVHFRELMTGTGGAGARFDQDLFK